jgi:hypothetical protein
MSFLEMTKLHLARQVSAKPIPNIRTSDGHIIYRLIWKSETAIIFRDTEGHFWRYLINSQKSNPALIRTK